MQAVDSTTHEPRTPMPVPDSHFVNGTELKPPFPVGLETAIFGMGCFWGVEKRFWELDGVYTTAVGYAGRQPGASYVQRSVQRRYRTC